MGGLKITGDFTEYECAPDLNTLISLPIHADIRGVEGNITDQ